MHAALRGFYRIQVHGQDGELKQDTGWFENLITNQGLDWFGQIPSGYSEDMTFFCFVGTGTAPPTYTDTTMTSNVPPGALRASRSQSYIAGPPAYWSQINSYQWAQGAIVGNISEVGVGDLTSHNSPYTGTPALFSHALIVDSHGNPTTLPVLSTDTLSISYECRLYLNTTDTNYSLTIGGTTYSGIFRLADIGSPTFVLLNSQYEMSTDQTYPQVFYYNGTIGAITSSPSGSSIGGNPAQISWSAGSYTTGAYTIQFTGTIPANSQGALNISAVAIVTVLGFWQFSVSPTLVRASYQSITTTWALSWGRY